MGLVEAYLELTDKETNWYCHNSGFLTSFLWHKQLYSPRCEILKLWHFEHLLILSSWILLNDLILNRLSNLSYRQR